ncbi:MAG: hypothetical protein ACFE8B_13285, partial [Candidatus Hermodarchaeota archaeon]
MEEFLNCLSCGRTLGSKEREHSNFCAECVLNLQFQLKDIDRDDIDQNLQKILDFFVSDVSAA